MRGAEVMRAFPADPEEGRERPGRDQKRKAREVEALTLVLGGHSQGEQAAQLKILQRQKKERESALDNVLALDHALRLAGSGLGRFWPGPQETFSTRCTAPLRPSEDRRWVAAADDSFPYAVPAHLAGKGRRAVIVDVESGNRRYEVPEYENERPMLALTGDEGSKFFAATWFLQGHCKLRMGWTRDPGHRRWRDWQLAVEAMGWRPLLLEMLVPLNLPFGPWLSEAWFAQIKEAMGVYMASHSFNDPLFLNFYEHMCVDLGLEKDADYGSAAHRNQVFEMLACDSTFTKKGQKVAMRSFFKWPEAIKTFLLSWHIKHFILVYIGLQLGHYSKTKVPLPGGQAQVRLDTACKVTGPAAQGSAEDKKVDSLRAQCQNAIHLCAELLSCPTRRRRCALLARLSDPVRQGHRLEEQGLLSDASVSKYYVHLAKGDYSFTLHQTFTTLVEPDTVHVLGVAFQELGGKAAKVFELDPRQKALVGDETEILQEALDFVGHLLKYRSQSMAHHSHSFPGQFALLLGEDEATRQAGLEAAKKAWHTMEAGERKAKELADVARLLRTVAFSSWVWPREVLLQLAQWSFEFVPPPVADSIRTLYQGYGHSLVNENCINQVKDQYRDAKGVKVCREKRLYTPVAKQLLTKLYKRPEVLLSESSEAGLGAPGRPRFLPKTAFESQQGQPSMDHAVLKEICRPTATWPSFTPLSAHNIVSAWQLLLRVHEADSWGDVSMAWKAVFVQELCVLEKLDTKKLFWVLHSDAYGVMGIPVTKRSIGALATIIEVPKRFLLTFQSVLDFDSYHVWTLEPLGPNRRFYELKMNHESDQMFLRLHPTSSTILEHVARKAFKGVTDAFLKKLIAFMGFGDGDIKVEGDSVAAHVELLVRSIFPGLSDSELAKIMAQRLCGARTAASRVQVDPDMLDQVLDSTDKKDVKTTNDKIDEETTTRAGERAYLQQAKYWKHVAEHLGISAAGVHKAAGPAEAGAAASSGSGGAPAAAPLLRVEGMELKAARAALPKYKGCLIQDYPLKSYYQVYYSESEMVPRSRCFNFGKGPWTQQQCLFSCVKWAWGRHTLHTGQACPHTFADDVCPPP